MNRPTSEMTKVNKFGLIGTILVKTSRLTKRFPDNNVTITKNTTQTEHARNYA